MKVYFQSCCREKVQEQVTDFLILRLVKLSFSCVHCNVLVQYVGIFQTFQEFF